MPKFGQKSTDRLNTCDERLQRIMRSVVTQYDISVVWGHRGQVAQNEAFSKGNSKKQWPDSRHNIIPSLAIDIIPYPSGWPDKNSPDFEKQMRAFYYMAGVVKTVARTMRITVVWGGDWDSDNDFIDNHFDDLGHFQVKDN
ncbi:hypothetical protein MNBD_ALPHA03-1282 [hydrothermal vent metagenome]|uniref:Peptidase M15C domain-containing protein n=1 Tax=hydrothermal vent metagenome TaxID=652676 RepID=A0A3B1BNU2_9ZZZZ